jgi:hypothetical protein
MTQYNPSSIQQTSKGDLERSSFTFDENGNTVRRVVSQFPSVYFDTFGRFKVASPFKLSEYSSTQPHDYLRYHCKKVAGSGTVTQDTSKAQSYLNLSTVSGDSAMFRSIRKIQYNKANAQEIFIIWRPDIGKENLVQEAGYNDDSNGIFWRKTNKEMQIVLRSSTSGSVIDTVFPRSEWDDPLDGSGPSGLAYDFDQAKQLVFYFDFGWLSSRGFRAIIDVNGTFVLVKSYLISGMLTVPFMATANLPLTFKAYNTGTTSSLSQMAMSCYAVQSSGSDFQEGPVRPVSLNGIPVEVTTTEKIIAGIRINPAYKNASIVPSQFNITPFDGTTFVSYRVLYNPTIVGAVWSDISGIAQSLVSYASYSGGSDAILGHVYLGNKQSLGEKVFTEVLSDLYLGYDCDDVPNALVLTAKTTSSTGDLLFDGLYKEFI